MDITRTTALVGRAWGWLALAALIGAWTTQLRQQPLFGMSQQHLFNDAIVMALLCIASLLDSLVHSKGYRTGVSAR